MLRKCFPFALLAFSLAGCASIPNVAPVAMDNPANSAAPSGRPYPSSDFLNVASATAESAPIAITAGAGLPGAPPSVHADTAAAPAPSGTTPGMNMKMSSGRMSGARMKMDMSKNMEGK